MDPTQRFSDRVETYSRYRPGYPPALLDHLGLGADQVVADIGSGTGLLSRVFLEAGHMVYGVEPNQPMRLAGEAELAGYPNFRSLEGRAEATGLPAGSIDLVVAGQAFHWFDPEPTRAEFARILRPRGGAKVALVYNERNQDSAFEQAYGQLMDEFAPSYRELRSERSGPEVITAFLGPHQAVEIPSQQLLDLPALRGRLLSSSCIPGPGQPGFEALEARIREVFAAHQQDGVVALTYTTRLYWR